MTASTLDEESSQGVRPGMASTQEAGNLRRRPDEPPD